MTTHEWNELQLAEEPAIALLRALGYQYVPPDQLQAEREREREAVLVPRLEQALRRLNPWLPEEGLRRAVRAITHVEAASLLEANEKVWVALTYGYAVEVNENGRRLSRTVCYLDFDNPAANDLLVSRQYRVAGVRRTVVPDVVVFVNGLPLVVIECKAPTLGEEWRQEALDRLARYQEIGEEWRQQGAPQLFHAAQVLVGTCGQRAVYGTVGMPERAYLEWKDPYPLAEAELEQRLGHKPTPQDVLIAGILTPSNLLDLVQNFVVFDRERGRTVKKLARYQQLRAVNKAIHRIRTAPEPTRRGGIVWHTQGSGKSLIMLWLAVKLRRLPELQNPTIVIVTDRKDLDKQITDTFHNCRFPNPVRARSVRHLREVLTSGAGQTVMTTVQKFQDATTYEGPRRLDGVLTDGSNVFVMVDEAHRTQYRNLAAYMRQALPNACFLGFTGTPIDRRDRSTPRTFGDYIDRYTIHQAVEDRATVPIFYEARATDEHILSGETLDAIFERIFAGYSPDEREAIKAKYATELAIAGAPRRIERICLDIIDHYERFIRPNGFKAQVVAASRDIAVTYKETLDRLNGPPSALVMTFNNDDPERIARHRQEPERLAAYIESFKNDPPETLSVLIVCDMLLTGFDAPMEQVMYLDAPLREHTLLQAIARVNRPFEGKDYGLVVDYWGISRFLQDALGISEGAFLAEEVQEAMLPKASQLPEVEVLHRAAMRFFDRVDHEDLDACVRVLEPEDKCAQFDHVFRKLSRALDMLLPDPSALQYVSDLKWLGKVRLSARARYRDEHFDLKGCGEKVRALISEHIGAEQVQRLLEPVSIFSPQFDEEVERLAQPEAKASEMEHAIRYEVKVRYEENPVLYQSLRERLERILRERQEERLSAAEEVRRLHTLVEELRSVGRTAQAMGLNETSLAIYDLLLPEREGGDGVRAIREANAPYVVDEPTRELASLVEEQLDELAVVDWTSKDDVQREMRRRVKRHLRAAGISVEKAESLVTSVMDLARRNIRR